MRRQRQPAASICAVVRSAGAEYQQTARDTPTKMAWMAKIDRAPMRLRAAGHPREAAELELWRNKDGTRGGWDKWFGERYPALAEVAGIEGHGAGSKPARIVTATTKTPSNLEDVVPQASLDEVLQTVERTRGSARMFDLYAFADYSGQKGDPSKSQGKGVVLAIANGDRTPVIITEVRSRRTLVDAFKRVLTAASERGARVLFGQDHQLGVPLRFAEELGISSKHGWRAAMRELFVRRFSAVEAGRFAHDVNDELRSLGRPEYFWSNTNCKTYDILGPGNPRSHSDPSQWRLTEARAKDEFKRRPFAFSQVGDNGTVGGQTIVGMPNVLELLDWADENRIRIAVWPFDETAVGAIGDECHVAVEPYPSHVRSADTTQSDINDALACVLWAQREERAGSLAASLSLASLDAEDRERARFEGWIAGVPT